MTPEEERYLLALKRRRAALAARDDLLAFAKYMRPDQDDHENPDKSAYQTAKHHKVIAASLEEIEKGKYKRIIVDLAPRHGKSEMTSRLFPAWYMGRNPRNSIIFATYNMDLAADFGRDVRTLMSDPLYQQVFPDVSLKVGAAAVDRLETEQGGKLFFTGVGGAITGRGASCFPAGTTVFTDKGEVAIEDIVSATSRHYVLSYDEIKETLEYKRVEAVASRETVGLRRISFASGGVVTATPDHPFYVAGRWKEARSLAPGDRVLRAVRDRSDQIRLRDQQTREARSDAPLLLRAMLVRAQEYFAVRRATLHHLRRAGAEGVKLRIFQAADVLGGLSPRGLAAQIRKLAGYLRRKAREIYLRGVQYALRFTAGHCRGEPDALLLAGLCGSGAFASYVGQGQSEVEKRGVSASYAAAFCEGVPVDAAEDLGAGWSRLRRLWRLKDASRSASYRQLADEQSGVKSRDPVLLLPSEMARCDGFETVEDVVAVVDDLHEAAVVYDIQVEDNHNFFANGVLVHNCIIADDLLKGRAEADSPTQREKLWKWWNEVLKTRLLSSDGRIVLISTRWHSDDVIGRLTDKQNDCYSPAEARKWRKISLPALAKDGDILGRKPGEALWPERFPVSYLEDVREADPRGFQALYQGDPTPEAGAFFPVEKIRVYSNPTSRPPKDEMRFYIASDHAVSVAQDRDKTCIVPIGVDSDENIWVMDDVVWGRMSADIAVEKIIDLYEKYKPLYHWAERGHITKSIGPFLRKRMLERGVFASLNEIVPVHDKMTRAQSMQARMHMGKIYMPTFIPWFAEARHEMTLFPHGSHDDFCDAMALIGLGLSLVVRASPQKPVKKGPEPHTLGWIKDAARIRARERANSMGGW